MTTVTSPRWICTSKAFGCSAGGHASIPLIRVAEALEKRKIPCH
jgi:hypothetical protein